MKLFKWAALLCALLIAACHPGLASAQNPLRNANGVPYSVILGCDNLTPQSLSNPLCGAGGGGGGTASLTPFKQTGTVNVSATSGSSTRQALANTDGTLFVPNPGTSSLSVKLGNSAVTATTSDFVVPPGMACPFDATGSTHVAMITAVGSTPVAAYQGTGGGGACQIYVDLAAAGQLQGDKASGAPDAGNPVKTGGVAKSADPTAVADAQRVDDLHDVLGKKVTIPALRGQKGRQFTTITASALETTIVTAGLSGVFNDVYAIVLSNSSATDGECVIKDATAGTTVTTIEVKAGQTSGFTLDAGSALAQTTAANNWTATCTSLSSWKILAAFVKTKA